MKLECVIETEPNAAFRTRNLSPFPTAIFEVASAQYRTALIGLADWRITFVCFGMAKHFFSKKTRMPACVC